MKTSAKTHQFGNNPPEVTILNSEAKEPALRVATNVIIPTGLIVSVVAALFPEFASSIWFTILMAAVAILMPLITALFTRGYVWSPASVKKLLREVDVNLRAHYEAQIKKNNPYERPDKI